MGQRPDTFHPRGMTRAEPPLARPTPHPAAERIQRVRLILLLSARDLAATEDSPDPNPELLGQLRGLQTAAQRAWDRLTHEFTPTEITRALGSPASVSLQLGPPRKRTHFLLIGGQLYAARRITRFPPVIQSLWRLYPISPQGAVKDAYFVLRLKHGPDQCDCPDWYFRVHETDNPRPCKHLRYLDALGWLGPRPPRPPTRHMVRPSPH